MKVTKRNLIGPALFLSFLLSTGGASALSTPLPPLQIFGALSEKDEVAIGRDAARQVEQENRIVTDRTIAGYVDRLGQRLVQSSDRRNIRYTFKVIDKPEINAFALPGGYVYVYRGILDLAQNESELAGVLAHEISHVSQRHHADQLQKAQTIGLGLGLLDLVLGDRRGTAENIGALGANLFAQGVFFKFSRDAERDADREGVALLRRAGIDPHGMITLFQRMESVGSRNPRLVGDFFSSHPRLSERQTNISGMLQPSDSRLRQNSRDFQTVSRRLNRR